ncbi:MAG: zinc ribbon domain-containing protein [Deltaproteobacteria bacterium]|nr:zinc ribbon domain-containing protein [Deltaproteobacteria bacterium]
MPLYEYHCLDCGFDFEILIVGADVTLECRSCQSRNLQKLISAHSSASGANQGHLPGPRDRACCGSTPSQAAGCAGPGSCCGKTG